MTVIASDDDGKTDTDSDMATVWFTYTPPAINVAKTANPTSVPETGGDVEFSISVTNNGHEKVTIDLLSDSDFDLSARCPDAQGTLLQPGETCTCEFTEFIKDNTGENHVNTVTVVASDDDGNNAIDLDMATVQFIVVPPTAPTSVPTMTPIGTVLLTCLLGLIGAGVIRRGRR